MLGVPDPDSVSSLFWTSVWVAESPALAALAVTSGGAISSNTVASGPLVVVDTSVRSAGGVSWSPVMEPNL